MIGEPGAGKASVARSVHACSLIGGELTEIDAALAAIDGTVLWLQRLRARLSVTAGSVLLRHVEALEAATAAGVASLLEAIPEGSGPRILATATSEGSDLLVPRALLDHIGVTRIVVPPLRDRPEDVPVLVAEFARRFAVIRPAPRFTPEALQSLLRLSWPGNVRQLENLIRSLVGASRAGDIRLQDLPDEVRLQTARHCLSRLEHMELAQILSTLRQVDGNKLHAARMLGISRSTLYRKLRAFGIELDRTLF
ncbi:MAG: helix-turn-helix domain-containing protein [Actinomycetota bacterium]